MKAYIVIGSWDYEGEDIQGVWMTQQEADKWIYDYIEDRKQDGDLLPWNELTLYEVEGTHFTKLREIDRDFKQVFVKKV